MSPRVFGVTSSVGISLQLSLLGQALARVFVFLPDAMMPHKEHLCLDNHLTGELWLGSNTGICVYIDFHKHIIVSCRLWEWMLLLFEISLSTTPKKLPRVRKMNKITLRG